MPYSPPSRRSRLPSFLVPLILAAGLPPVCAEELAFWDFTTGPNGWTTNANIAPVGFTEEGWVFDSIAEDPHLTGPAASYPPTVLVRVTVRMKSEADSQGKIFWGETFAEERSREFTVIPDNEWREYEVYLNSLAPQSRLRLDPCQRTGRVELGWIRVESVPNPTLDNGTLEIQLDLRAGGSITHLARSGSGRNLVNLYDRGRYIQQSYYAGQAIDRRAEGQSPNWSPWSWNPIQVGDTYGNTSPILEAWVRDGVAYTKCQPLLWDMRNEKAECHIEMWVSLEANTVHVANRLTCFRTDNLWNLTLNHQELPAVYTIGSLFRLFTYTGDEPWSSGNPTQILNSGPPWEYWNTPEHWAALLDSNGFGVGVYNPSATLFAGGFHGSPGGGPYDSSTGYFTPLGEESLGKTSILSYEYDLIVGTLHDIRDFVYREEGKVYEGGPTSTPTFTPTITPTPSSTPSATPTSPPTPTETFTPTATHTPNSTRLSPNFVPDGVIDDLDLLEYLRRWRNDRTVPLVDLDGNDLVDGRDPLAIGVYWMETTAPSGR